MLFSIGHFLTCLIFSYRQKFSDLHSTKYNELNFECLMLDRRRITVYIHQSNVSGYSPTYQHEDSCCDSCNNSCCDSWQLVFYTPDCNVDSVLLSPHQADSGGLSAHKSSLTGAWRARAVISCGVRWWAEWAGSSHRDIPRYIREWVWEECGHRTYPDHLSWVSQSEIISNITLQQLTSDRYRVSGWLIQWTRILVIQQSSRVTRNDWRWSER